MDSDLERVRQLLLGQEYAELLELKSEYHNSQAFAEAVSRVIAEALAERNTSDDKVAQVLAPIIDGAIANSIDQDPRKLAESLYPIMGPAIRKSISETLQQMLENFNQLLEQSLSPRSLRWRFDAWRTGRSYSELVLINTLEYNVEQVYLIHRETSLLMRHVYSDLAERKDPDMVSGMFSAIQDFIQDSFSTKEGDVLDTLKLGDLSVVIQSGPTAVLAAVVRGIVPEHLRGRMQNVSETIHLLKRAELQDYSGDPDDFIDVEENLRGILEAREKQEEGGRRVPLLALVAIAAVLGVTGWFSWQDWLRRDARAQIVAAVDTLPGVVVLKDGHVDGNHIVTALVDPLADPFGDLLVPADPTLSPSKLQAYTYLSAEDVLVERRVNRRLPPPESVTYAVNDGVLSLTGTATVQWVEQTSPALMGVTGVLSLETDGLTLNNPVAERAGYLLSQIQAQRFEFDKQETTLSRDNPRLDELAGWMIELLANPDADADRFEIVGYTDEGGTRQINYRVGLGRAETLLAELAARGVPADRMQAFSGFDYHESAGEAAAALPEAREVRIYAVD